MTCIETTRKLEAEMKLAFATMFPLCSEHELPRAACHIEGFLKKRIAIEVEQATRHFTTSVVKVLCEISPPKTHVCDMARIVVQEAERAKQLEDSLRRLVTCKPAEQPLDAVRRELRDLQTFKQMTELAAEKAKGESKQ